MNEQKPEVNHVKPQKVHDLWDVICKLESQSNQRFGLEVMAYGMPTRQSGDKQQ